MHQPQDELCIRGWEPGDVDPNLEPTDEPQERWDQRGLVHDPVALEEGQDEEERRVVALLVHAAQDEQVPRQHGVVQLV